MASERGKALREGRMISCADAVRRLWEYLDGTVGEADRDALDAHLSRCRRCCAELEFAEELRGFLVRSADEEIPDDVMARLNGTLEELGGQAPETEDGSLLTDPADEPGDR